MLSSVGYMVAVPNHTTETTDRTMPGPRLGMLIEERRHQLKLSKVAAAKRAGINRGTWHEVENGTRTNIMPETLSLIEAALEWEPGTLFKLMHPQTADVVISQPDGTVTIVEGRTTRVEQSPSAAMRHQLIARIAAMTDDELPRLLSMLDGEDRSETAVSKAEFNALVERINQMTSMNYSNDGDGDGHS